MMLARWTLAFLYFVLASRKSRGIWGSLDFQGWKIPLFWWCGREVCCCFEKNGLCVTRRGWLKPRERFVTGSCRCTWRIVGIPSFCFDSRSSNGGKWYTRAVYLAHCLEWSVYCADEAVATDGGMPYVLLVGFARTVPKLSRTRRSWPWELWMQRDGWKRNQDVPGPVEIVMVTVDGQVGKIRLG